MQTLDRYDSFIYEKTWIVPLAITIIFQIVLYSIIYIDPWIAENSQYINKYISIDQASSHTILNILASTTISVTSVIFSITILVLSNTSNKYGSRLLPTFMRQKVTQRVMGLFIGSFIYCLIALLLIESIDIHNSTARLIVLIAVFLGILCFLSLVIFIHFVCNTIQADNILLYLSRDLKSSIVNYYNTLRNIANKTPDSLGVVSKIRTMDNTSVLSLYTGYVTLVKFKSILSLAENNNLIVKLEIKPGSFIFKNQEIMKVYHAQDKIDSTIIEKLKNEITVENRRMHIQDVEFCFEEIAEIALLALSPGVCNPYLAVHCINRIMYGLVTVDEFECTQNIFSCSKENPRLIIKNLSGADVVRASLNRIRQQAENDLTIIIHLIRSIHKVYRIIENTSMKNELASQIRDIMHSSGLDNCCSRDKEIVDNYYTKFKEDCVIVD